MLDLDRMGMLVIKCLQCVIPSLVLFMEFAEVLESTLFVIPVYIFDTPGIFCDSFNGGIIV